MKKTSKRTAGSHKRSRRPPGTPAPRLGAHESALVAFAAVAQKLALRWYVFGAQAVNLYGFPRATADLDLTIDLGSRTPRTLLAALDDAGFDARFGDSTFIAATRVIPIVHRDSQLPIDVVLAGPGLEQQFLDEIETHDLAGIPVPVISIENLMVTKVLAGRPRDKDDVREIVARSNAVDHAKVESLLAVLEDALGQSDLVPLYRKLRAEANRKRGRRR